MAEDLIEAAVLDVTLPMLAVARASTPSGTSIVWYVASAEAIPLPVEVGMTTATARK